MKVVISTILFCLIFHFSYSQDRFWGVMLGASLDSTSRSVYDAHGLISYVRDSKLTYRDGIIGDVKFSAATLLFNQSDQLYKGIFIFWPKSYTEMVEEYQRIRQFIEMQTFEPDISLSEFPNGQDSVTSSISSAYSLWHYPKGAEEITTSYTVLLRMEFTNSSPLITLEYTSNKFVEK